LLVLVKASCLAGTAPQTQVEKARSRVSDLRFGSYATSHQVEQLATDETLRAHTWEAIQTMGITKLYVEVYRGGHVVSPDRLVFIRDWLRQKGLDVVGGIATVPGGEIGVRQEGPLSWFSWQNDKTQHDLEKIMRWRRRSSMPSSLMISCVRAMSVRNRNARKETAPGANIAGL